MTGALAKSQWSSHLIKTCKSELASFFNSTGVNGILAPLLRHYLYLAPDARNRAHVEADIRLLETLDAERLGLHEQADRQALALIEMTSHSNGRLMAQLGKMLDVEHPGVVVGLAIFMEVVAIWMRPCFSSDAIYS